ncbi:hypothetical protein Ancab_033322 [Ancistrocladus abbreviatus]
MVMLSYKQLKQQTLLLFAVHQPIPHFTGTVTAIITSSLNTEAETFFFVSIYTTQRKICPPPHWKNKPNCSLSLFSQMSDKYSRKLPVTNLQILRHRPGTS